MNIILLSGGSGKRLWPLSNDIRSKQFIKIFLRIAVWSTGYCIVFRKIKTGLNGHIFVFYGLIPELKESVWRKK